MDIVEKRLQDLGIELPKPPTAVANYLPYVKTGDLLYVSGTLAMKAGEMSHTGKVGETQSVESGYEAARNCALNTLSIVKDAIGSLEGVVRCVFLGGYVNAIEGFAESPLVINGASDLFVEIFGEAGRHSRAAVAVSGLPKNSTVEIQCVFEV